MEVLSVGRLCLTASLAFMLSGCSNSVHPPKSALGDIGQVQSSAPIGYSSTSSSDGINVQAETAVANGSLKAWRRAIAGDEKGAMKYLDDVEKRYPNLATTRTMRAQCLEKLGKKKEAIPYYQDAARQNEYSSINNFKLAEAKRTTGDAKGSIEDYRRLIKMAPEFEEGKIGLAKALITTGDKNGARAELQEVLKQNPENVDAKSVLERLDKQ